MDIRTAFSRKSPRLDLDLSAAHPGAASGALATGIGAAIGAVLAGTVGGFVAGPLGSLCAAVAGAIAGAALVRHVSGRMDQSREEAYWRERPYVDTAFGFHDGALAEGAASDPVSRPAPLGLADIAAHPAPRRSRHFETTLPGRPTARPALRHRIGDLAAQTK